MIFSKWQNSSGHYCKTYSGLALAPLRQRHHSSHHHNWYSWRDAHDLQSAFMQTVSLAASRPPSELVHPSPMECSFCWVSVSLPMRLDAQRSFWPQQVVGSLSSRDKLHSAGSRFYFKFRPRVIHSLFYIWINVSPKSLTLYLLCPYHPWRSSATFVPTQRSASSSYSWGQTPKAPRSRIVLSCPGTGRPYFSF